MEQGKAEDTKKKNDTHKTSKYKAKKGLTMHDPKKATVNH